MNKSVVELLLLFREQQDPNILLKSELSVSCDDLNSIAIELLGWLRLGHKRNMWIAAGRKASHKPLHYDSSIDWQAKLEQFVLTEEPFRNIFKAGQGQLDFSDDIPEEVKTNLRREAYEKEVLYTTVLKRPQL